MFCKAQKLVSCLIYNRKKSGGDRLKKINIKYELIVKERKVPDTL
jgi:hypothetical protein